MKTGLRYVFFLIILFAAGLAQADIALDNVQKLLASDGAAYDGFGVSVSVSGDTALIAKNYNSNNYMTASNLAYVFSRAGDGT